MCIIIHKPVGETISDNTLRSALDINRDGFGFMHSGIGHKQLTVSFDNARRIIDGHADKSVCYHFRMNTHGNTTKANVHPFKFAGKYWGMHNGTMSEFAIHKTKSDSRIFFESWLAPLVVKGRTPSVKEIDARIGSSNRIVTMDSSGLFTFYNRARWTEHNGCLFSNTYAWDAPFNARYPYGGFDSDDCYYVPAVDGRDMREIVESRIAEYSLRCGDNFDLLEPWAGDARDFELWEQWRACEIDIYTYARRLSDTAALDINDCIVNRCDVTGW